MIVGSTWPTFHFTYKKAIPGIFSSDTDFDLIELTVDQDLKVGAFGDSKWRISAGTFLGGNVIEISDYKYFRRSDRYFFSKRLADQDLEVIYVREGAAGEEVQRLAGESLRPEAGRDHAEDGAHGRLIRVDTGESSGAGGRCQSP